MAWGLGDEIVSGGLVGLAVVGLFVPWLARPAKWKVRTDPGLMVYRTPAPVRLYLGAGGLWLIASTLQIGWGGGAAGGFVTLLGAVFGLALLWLSSQRYELRLDAQRRTYRLTRGWLLWSRVRSGPWEDFAGVFVRCHRMRGGEVCFVGLDWRDSGGGRPYLGRYGDVARAEAAASELAEALCLPRVPTPPPEGFRSLTR